MDVFENTPSKLYLNYIRKLYYLTKLIDVNKPKAFKNILIVILNYKLVFYLELFLIVYTCVYVTGKVRSQTLYTVPKSNRRLSIKN